MKNDFNSLINFDDFKYSQEFFDLRISKKYYYLTFSISLFIFLFFFWSFVFDFDGVAKGKAIIRPAEEVSLIKIQNSGFVTEKKYINGQIVKEGDVLVLFNTSVLQLEIENQKKLIEKNQKELNFLKCLNEMVEKNEIDENADSEVIIQAGVYFSNKKIKELNYEKAKRNYDLEIALPESATYKQRLFELKNSYELAEADLNSFISDFKYNLLTRKTELMYDTENQKKELFELEEKLDQCTIYAPKNGIIEEMETFDCGDFLTGGENILRIIPLQTEKIKAQVIIGQTDIANLNVGQNVKIKLDALNSNEYGKVKGKVTRIGADSLYDANQNSYYQIDVEIPNNTVKSKKSETILLRPGMTGTARIVIKRKKMIKIILDKLNLFN